jgi:hypothetical protein
VALVQINLPASNIHENQPAPQNQISLAAKIYCFGLTGWLAMRGTGFVGLLPLTITAPAGTAFAAVWAGAEASLPNTPKKIALTSAVIIAGLAASYGISQIPISRDGEMLLNMACLPIDVLMNIGIWKINPPPLH